MATTHAIPGLDLTGIREHRDGWQVRVHPFPARNFTKDQLLEAVAHRDQLRALRGRGVRELPTIEPQGIALNVIAGRYRDAERKRMRAEGRGPRTLEKLDYKLRPWVGEVQAVDGLGRTFAGRTVAGITAGDVHDWVVDRAADHPTTARDELAGLRAVLRYAEDRDVPVDHRIYRVRAPRHERREGIALSYPELEHVASFAFDYAWRLFMFGGTVGNRIGELLAATDDWFDPDAMTLAVPASVAKERREKVIQLWPQERDWLVDQQQARTTLLRGPRHLFPRKNGQPFQSESGWWTTVWAGTIRRAITRHQTENDGREPRWGWWARDERGEPIRNKDGSRRFDGLQPHDLRRTAISLMREASMPEEYVAARVGHIDERQQKTYRKVRDDEQRRFIRQVGAGLGSHLTAAHAADAEAAR